MYVFLNSGQILKPSIEGENGIKINSEIPDRLPIRKMGEEFVKFFKKIKNAFSGVKIWTGLNPKMTSKSLLELLLKRYKQYDFVCVSLYVNFDIGADDKNDRCMNDTQSRLSKRTLLPPSRSMHMPLFQITALERVK